MSVKTDFVGVIHILLKDGVPNHEADGMKSKLASLGFEDTEITMGQCHRVEFSAEENRAKEVLEDMCHKLLMNPKLHRADVRSVRSVSSKQEKSCVELAPGGKFLGIVHTFNRRAVLNPEEKTVRDALNGTLGFTVSRIELGKCFHVEFSSPSESPEKTLRQMSKQFFNPIMHECEIEEVRPV